MMDSLRLYYLVFLLCFTTFLLTFSKGENPLGCNGYYKNKTGNITSPGYPSQYPDEAECSHIIGVQTLSTIRITFHDVQFETPFDSLFYGSGRIVDTGKSDGKVSGREIPETIELTTDSGMWFYLMTDNGIGYRGFSLSWIIQDYCGGTFFEEAGSLSSPNYPSLYQNNLNCLYVIKLNRTSRIQLKSDTFSLEPQYDLLAIESDSNTSTIALTGNYSGAASLDIEVDAKILRLRFTTDYAVQNAGFNISWDAVDLPATPTATTLSPCDRVDIPDKERQLQQSNVVLKIVVGTVIGIVAVVLLVVVGLAYLKRCKNPKSSPSLPLTNISHREPPSGVSMDDVSHIEDNKTGGNIYHDQTLPMDDNVVKETHVQIRDNENDQSQPQTHDRRAHLSATIDV